MSATGPRGTIVRTLNETSDYILPAKDEPLLGATSLMMLASVFLRLIEGEYKLMKSIIPSEHQELILDKLVEKSLANFLTEYETVYSRAKNSLTSKKEFIVVIPLFRIIKHLNGLLPGYQSIMEKSLAKSHTRIMSLTVSLLIWIWETCEYVSIDTVWRALDAIPRGVYRGDQQSALQNNSCSQGRDCSRDDKPDHVLHGTAVGAPSHCRAPVGS